MFRTWRKERIQKLKEQDEAEIMAEPAPIFSAIVQSGVTIVALETDSKPRTVSHEEGEDDTAPNTVYYNMHTNIAKDIEEQVSTLHSPNVRINIHDKLDMHVPLFIRSIHACTRFQASCYTFDLDGARCYQGIDSVFDLRDRRKDTWFERKKIKLILLFLFLPRKLRKRSYSLGTLYVWQFLCLKATGWGPPCHDQEKTQGTIFRVGLFYYLEIFMLLSRETRVRLFYLFSKLIGYYIKPRVDVL
jgi:hypothetical protein